MHEVTILIDTQSSLDVKVIVSKCKNGCKIRKSTARSFNRSNKSKALKLISIKFFKLSAFYFFCALVML